MMNIRIARNGTEIARVQNMEMLRHVVSGRSVLVDDYAFVEGSVDWILVSELLATESKARSEIVLEDVGEGVPNPAHETFWLMSLDRCHPPPQRNIDPPRNKAESSLYRCFLWARWGSFSSMPGISGSLSTWTSGDAQQCANRGRTGSGFLQ